MFKLIRQDFFSYQDITLPEHGLAYSLTDSIYKQQQHSLLRQIISSPSSCIRIASPYFFQSTTINVRKNYYITYSEDHLIPGTADSVPGGHSVSVAQGSLPEKVAEAS